MTTLSATPAHARIRASAVTTEAGAYDAPLVFLCGLLMTFGVAIVYSASVDLRQPFELRNWWNSPLRQSVFAVAGFLVMIVAAHFDYRWLAWIRRVDGWRAGVLALLALLLLLAVQIPGVGAETLGARRSITVMRGSTQLGFQPSEIAKVVLVIWLAALMTRPNANLRNFRSGLLPVLVSGGALIGLTLIEDFGTAALMGVVLFFMLFMGGANWKHLAALVLLGALVGAAGVAIKPYRIERLKTFFAEARDPRGEGYQVGQAMIAIGSGGWFGRGLGAGVQKYGYLPQDNNDFVLAIVCEELGIVGGMVVAGLFLQILWRGWRIAVRCPDPFGRLLAAGLTLTICLQAAFNIGVVTDSIPTKGISLPFVSAGGSGVLFLGAAAGLLASVGRSAIVAGRRS